MDRRITREVSINTTCVVLQRAMQCKFPGHTLAYRTPGTLPCIHIVHGGETMPSHSLQGLLVDNLKDLVDAEKQLTRALPKMARKTTSEELRAGIESHLRQTEGHIDRLNEVFEVLGETPRGKKCAGVQGLLEEGSKHLERIEKGAAMDALIIASAQKVEHYEIAVYGTVRTWAAQLGHSQAAQLLELTLEEEKATDKQLSDLAESMVNPQAAEAGKPGDEHIAGRARPRRARAAMAAERRTRAAARSRRTRGGKKR